MPRLGAEILRPGICLTSFPASQRHLDKRSPAEANDRIATYFGRLAAKARNSKFRGNSPLTVKNDTASLARPNMLKYIDLLDNRRLDLPVKRCDTTWDAVIQYCAPCCRC